MSVADFLWIILPVAAALAALLLFARKRRRTSDYAEGQAFRAALPWWVGTIERVVALACAFLFAVGTWKIYLLLSGDTPSPGPISQPGPVYVVLGIGLIILPLALLCANVVSWVVPPLRSANQRAFRGSGLSFRRLNLGLMKASLVFVSAGLVLLVIAASKPWSG